MATDDTLSTSKGLCPACGFEATDGSTVCPKDGVVLIPQLVDPYVGKTLDGRYQIESVIGFGGITVVYKAVDSRLNRPVVIKMLHSELVDDHRKLQRFQRGARAASVLNHPNIVAVHDCVLTESGNCYLVMDYAEGTTLSDLVGYQGAIGVERGIRIFSQVCDALAHAHDKKIIHRNLKPSNILITRAPDGSDLVKLGDFGIAKQLVGEGEVAQKVTRTGQWVGSPLYMSPEQAQSKPVDVRSDVFSLGKVMLEAFKGRLPILADSMVEIPDAARAPQPHPEYVDPIPAPLRQILSKTLQKDPKARYQNIRELKRDLDHLLGGKGKAGLSFGMQISRLQEKLGPLPMIAGSVLVLSVVLAAAYMWYSSTENGKIELTKLSMRISELSSAPDDPKLLEQSNTLGEMCMKAGRYKDAVTSYESAVRAALGSKGKVSIEELQAYRNLFRANQAAGDLAAARQAAQKGMEIADAMAKSLRSRGDNKSMNELVSVLAIQEEMVSFTKGPDSRNRADILYQLGQAASQVGDFADARRWLLEALRLEEINPHDDAGIPGWASMELAKMYHLSGESSKCERTLKQVLEKMPKMQGNTKVVEVAASNQLGEYYLSQKKPDEALARFQHSMAILKSEGIDSGAAYSTTASFLAVAYKTKGDYAKAVDLLKKALATDCGSNPRTRIELERHLAACYGRQGKFAESEKLMADVMILQEKSEPSDGVGRYWTYSTMAEICMEKKQYEKAVAWYKKAFKMRNPNSIFGEIDSLNALMQIAVCYALDGKPVDSDSTYKQVMVLEEASPRVARMRLSGDSSIYADFLSRSGHPDLAHARRARTAQILSRLGS